MNEIQKTIAQYVLRSAGTCNHLTSHTLSCFVGMIETGEADIGDFRIVGGEALAKIVADALVESQRGEQQ